MILGWGGSMILGVALYFLPRLRGTKLVGPQFVPSAFYLFAGGTILRLLSQPLSSLAETAHLPQSLLPGITLTGTFLQTTGIGIVLTLLFLTFRNGMPIREKKGFLQIVPPLAVAGTAFLLAESLWITGAASAFSTNSSLLPHSLNRTAITLLLFGGIPAISLAISARLFPLSFRIRHPSRTLLWIASALLATGMILTLLAGLNPGKPKISAAASLTFAAGIATGIGAVRVWEKRMPYPGKNRPYHLSKDPAGIGVLIAYCWVALAGGFLLLSGLQLFNPAFFAAGIAQDLALHAAGAGFMTTLILSVGWNMLPGFAGGSPRGTGWFLTALILANLAALLRLIPGTLLLFSDSATIRKLYYPSFATAGISGLLAILAFTRALFTSWWRQSKT